MMAQSARQPAPLSPTGQPPRAMAWGLWRGVLKIRATANGGPASTQAG
ncbi:MAG: hypothetical protein ACKN9T_01935 [Candidatus Methylumidiphilus sp.]